MPKPADFLAGISNRQLTTELAPITEALEPQTSPGVLARKRPPRDGRVLLPMRISERSLVSHR